jgi:uncharacterized protein with von Willebrand factor type A (vWA) domain
MKIQAYATSTITESIVAFSQFVRTHGLNVGVEETEAALCAAEKNLLPERKSFKNSLKVIFCTSPEERQLFEKLFSLYWDTNPMDLRETKNKTTIRGVTERKANRSLVMLGQGKTDKDSEEGKTVSGANETERLQKTDFAKLNEIDPEPLEKIAEKLFKEMSVRLKRRMKETRKNGLISLRRTIRRSIGSGGEPIELYHRAQKPKRHRLVVLLDVSGSMDKYSFYLLRFICALRENFRQAEAFVFSTSLIRISKALEHNYLDAVLSAISQKADNWSGGTRIGDCLQEFNDKYGKRMLNGLPFVIILSDGLDTGEPEKLGKELLKIKRRSKKLIWLNPLKGMKGYEPVARGMKEALPVIDDFRTAHNLESLLALENILNDV